MARRNDHSRAELKRMSLEAAEEILSTEGAQALSVRRIAQRIGYTHGTLYLLFRNLDGLLLELNGRTLDALTGALERSSGDTGSVRDRLRALAATYLDFARTHTARWRLVFEHHLPPGEATPDWLGERIARGFRVLDTVLADGGAPPGERGALGAALWSSIHGVTVLAVSGKLVDHTGAPLEPQPVLERTVDAFLAALEGPRGGGAAAEGR